VQRGGRQLGLPRSLRARLLLIVALALTPLALAGVIQGNLLYRVHEQEADRLLRDTALYATHNEQNIFHRTELFLTALSRRPELLHGADECSRLLSTARIDARAFRNITLVDAKGTAICMAVPSPQEIDYAQFSWWPAVRLQRGIVIGNQFVSPVVKRVVLPIVLPLYDGSGAFAGALSASFDVEWLKRTMHDGKLPPDSLMLIVNRTGNVIAASRDAPSVLVQSVLSHALNHEKIFATTIDGKEHWRWAVEPLGGADKFIAFGMPEPRLVGISRIYHLANVVLPVLMVILASLAIWLGTEWHVIRWTLYLKRVSAAYARNHFSLKLERLDEAPEEFRGLGHEMKNMARSIRDRDRTLSNALEQKSAMAREIHHRVRNNLQIVSSLISIYSRNILDHQAETAFKQIVARVDALTLIQRLIDKNDTNPTVDMNALFTQLADQIRALAADGGRPYRLTLAAEGMQLPPDIATPVVLFAIEGLLFELFQVPPDANQRNPVLSFSGYGDGHLMLVIEDSVLGAETLRTGTPSSDKIFGALAEQLHGQYRIEKSPNGGCRLSLIVPFRPEDDGRIRRADGEQSFGGAFGIGSTRSKFRRTELRVS
jgi:hypothetical protein